MEREARTKKERPALSSREAIHRHLPALLGRLSPRVGAWLVPLALSMGCAPLQTQQTGSMEAFTELVQTRTNQLARNEIMPSHTHTTPDGRTWTPQTMTDYVGSLLGTEYVQNTLLGIEYHDQFRQPGQMEHNPSHLHAQPSAEQRSPETPSSLVFAGISVERTRQFLPSGYPSSWFYQGQIPHLTHPTDQTASWDGYGMPADAQIAGQCLNGHGLDTAEINLYESSLFPGGIFRPDQYVRTLNHELAHSRDALSGETTPVERVAKAFYSLHRLQSGEGMTWYLDNISGPDPRARLLHRSDELFAIDHESLFAAEEQTALRGGEFTARAINEELANERQISLETAAYIQQSLRRFSRLGTLAERATRARARNAFVEQLFTTHAQRVVQEAMFRPLAHPELRDIALREIEPALHEPADAMLLQQGLFLSESDRADIRVPRLSPQEEEVLERYRNAVNALQDTSRAELTSSPEWQHLSTMWEDQLRRMTRMSVAWVTPRTSFGTRNLITRFGDVQGRWNELLAQARSLALKRPEQVAPLPILARTARDLISLEAVARPDDLPVLRQIAQRYRDTYAIQHAHSPL